MDRFTRVICGDPAPLNNSTWLREIDRDSILLLITFLSSILL